MKAVFEIRADQRCIYFATSAQAVWICDIERDNKWITRK
jgi:hypothetical protein